MSSRYSPAARFWESAEFKVSKHKTLISVSIAFVFIIVLVTLIGMRGQQNEETFNPEIPDRSAASLPLGNNPVEPYEPSAPTNVIQKGIYFATYGGTVSFFSPATRYSTTIHSGDEDFRGVTYDPVKAKLYWSSNTKIYRGNMDGTEATMVFNTTLYGEIKALAFDWITGNIYGVCWRHGYIFACNANASPLVCATVLSNQGKPNGLALNPTEGRMYWTLEVDESVGLIRRAEMDGSNVTLVKAGLKFPYGITIDYRNSRLYWTDFGSENILTSGLDGSNSLLVFQTSDESKWAGIWGIALLNDRIYWGTWNTMNLESCDRNGDNFRIDYNGEKRNVHLVSTGMELPRSRANHCAVRNCSAVCVLTATSARCLN